jgi:RNA polymerase primary sigma factor
VVAVNLPRVWTLSEERAAGARLVAARASEDPKAVRAVVNEFAARNLRLVYIAANEFRWSGVEQDDLVQNGNLGLIRAAEKFDPERGFKFCTYANRWVRVFIWSGIAEADAVHVPSHVREAWRLVRKANARVAASTGREATEEELLTMTGLTRSQLALAAEADCSRVVASLDAPVFEGEVGSMVECMPDHAPSPEDLLLQREVEEEARRLLDSLPSREAAILRLRLSEKATLREIGEWQKPGVSRERIRQIEVRGLRLVKQRARFSKAAELVE